MYNDGIRKYRENDVVTIGPERMIVMLYEGVVQRLEETRSAIAAGDIPGRALALDRARDIIAELNHSLDFEVGGEIARNLSALYGFLGREILEARITARTEHLDNALRVIRPVLEAWRTLTPGTAERARSELRGGSEDGPVLATVPPVIPAEEAQASGHSLSLVV